MAIKGKKKSRGGGRARVATAPRPVLVSGRRPALQRTGVRITLIVVLLGLIGLLASLFVREGNRNEAKATAQGSVRQFQTRVEAALAAKSVGQDLGTGFVVLPEFGQMLSGLQSGDVKAKDVTDRVKTWVTDTTEAADKIAALQTGTSVYADDLNDVREQLRTALALYTSMSRTLGVAATLEGKDQEDLLTALQEQYTQAAAVWDAGWQELVEIRTELGIAEAVQAPTGLPGGGVPGLPGGGIPGVGGEVPST